MALPKIDLPIYELKLPSNDKKVKYRPFTVKEEKILLIAQESGDSEQVALAIKQTLNNCLIDYDVDNLSLFDVEYILINLRAKSIDNKIEFEIEDPDTKERIKLNVDLSEVKVHKDKNHTNRIKIDDTYTLFLKYPTINNFSSMIDQEGVPADKTFDIFTSCLDKLASEETVYKFSDFSKKEVDDFIESLHGDVTKKIKEFFDTIPKVRHEVKYKNSEGKEKIFVLEGLQSFFI